MNTILSRLTMPAALLATLSFVVGCGETFRVVDTGQSHVTVSNDEGTDIETHEVAPDAEITLDGEPATLEQLDPGDTIYVSLEDRDGMDVATTIRATTPEDADAEQADVAPLEPSTSPIESEPVVPLDSAEREIDEIQLSDELPEPAEPAESDLPEENTTDAETDILLPDTTEPEAETPSETPDADVEPIDPEAGAPEEAAEPDDADAASETFEGTLASVTVLENQFVMNDAEGNEHTFMVNDETTVTVDGLDSAFGDLQADQMVKVSANREGDTLTATSVEATSK